MLVCLRLALDTLFQLLRGGARRGWIVTQQIAEGCGQLGNKPPPQDFQQVGHTRLAT